MEWGFKVGWFLGGMGFFGWILSVKGFLEWLLRREI